jgi:hypothetical protein
MKLPPTLAELQHEHVTMELECIDRMYLNAYVPQLTSEGGIAAFCRGYLGHRFASTHAAVPRTKAFVAAIHAFIEREGVELVRFKKGERKDHVMQKRLRRFLSDFGPFPQVLFLLSVSRQALPQRTRIPQAPARAARHRLRGPRQRPALLRRYQSRATHRRRPRCAEDRVVLPQVASPPAAPL